MRKFRKGDVVRLTGTIRHDQDADEKFVFVEVTGTYETIHINTEAGTIEFLHGHFEPGDLVETPDDPNSVTSGTMTATVIAVHKGIAWLEPDDGTDEMVERSLRDLSRVEKPAVHAVREVA